MASVSIAGSNSLLA